MPYCRNCGQSVAAEARICPNCNYPQDQPPPIRPPTASAPEAPPAPPVAPAPFAGDPQSFPGGAVYVRRTDGQAVASLVLGLVGLVICPIIPSIIAIALGKQSMTRIEQSQGVLEGHGMAKAGFILGIIGVVLWVLLIGLYIAMIGSFVYKGF